MQYAPFASDIELPFYTALATLKIDRDKLDDSARKVLDLKKYKFHYWFAFPALHSTPSWTPVPYSEEIVGDTPVEPINRSPFKALSTLESSTLVEAVQTWSRSVEACQRGFFLARKYPKLDGRPEHDSKEMTKIADGTLVASSQQSAGHNWEIASLASYESGFFDGVPFEDSFICFADPSNYDDAPGWMLRNLLFLIKQRWGLRRAQILRYRDTRCENGRSMVVTMECKGQLVSRPGSFPETVSGAPKVTGWERNSAGKLSGRLVDLTEYLNPKR
ncbi:Autophagy protein 7 [Aspergillus fumigatus]